MFVVGCCPISRGVFLGPAFDVIICLDL
uniref:Uncharacterized protein n=1 Tax=Anguilla anguilla TaxID=7936 RepID=A0A0E9R3Y8_ANGAN